MKWERAADRANLAAGALHVAQTAALVALLLTEFRGDGWWPLYIDGDRYTYRAAWLLPAFTGLSGAAALYLAWRPPAGLVNTPLWIEYSVSSGLMLWVVCTLCGIDALWKLALVAAANAAMMGTGYLAERAVEAHQSVHRSAVPRAALAWFAVGSLLFVAIFVPVWVYFFQRVADAPRAVYVIIIVITFMYSLFGVNAAHYLRLFACPCGRATRTQRGRFHRTRLVYALLSFSVKSFLAWFVLFGALRAPNSQ